MVCWLFFTFSLPSPSSLLKLPQQSRASEERECCAREPTLWAPCSLGLLSNVSLSKPFALKSRLFQKKMRFQFSNFESFRFLSAFSIVLSFTLQVNLCFDRKRSVDALVWPIQRYENRALMWPTTFSCILGEKKHNTFKNASVGMGSQ